MHVDDRLAIFAEAKRKGGLLASLELRERRGYLHLHAIGLAGAQAVFSLSPTDHSGAEPRSQVLVVVRDGAYRLVQ